jgi:intron-binding protein aquarius
VPTIDLNLQGRARPSIAQLYSWRYKDLGDLTRVLQGKEYVAANPGLTYEFQLIDVGKFNGVGETQPSPYFYQNLGEAEYIVACFMYMRLQGYPASKISILTTYNGQKHLIRDVIKQRCGWNPIFGEPSTITTVDRFQGQQNDYILVSLVKTENIGHIRDVRRLVVACSRARLGLYIFGHHPLFANCFEIAPTFRVLASLPTQLALEPSEKWPDPILPSGHFGAPLYIRGVEHMWAVLQALMQQTYLEEVSKAQEEYEKAMAKIREQQAEEAGEGEDDEGEDGEDAEMADGEADGDEAVAGDAAPEA